MLSFDCAHLCSCCTMISRTAGSHTKAVALTFGARLLLHAASLPRWSTAL